MKANRKITRGEKKWFLIAGFAIAFIVAFGAWRQWVDAIPEVQIPTPKMPSPNAYNFYVKAGAAIVKANPAVDPVFDKRTVPESEWKTRYPTAKKEAWLRQNATALKIMRQGFKYPCRVPPQSLFDAQGLFGLSSKKLSSLRSLARLSSVESHVRIERGNWSEASKITLDIFKLGHDVSQSGAVMDFLISVAINANGKRELWDILPHLSATDAKLASRRLEKIIETRVSYADVLREEKYSGQVGLLNFMRFSKWILIGPSKHTASAPFIMLWQTITTPRRTVFNNYTNYMDSLIVLARERYITKVKLPEIPNDMYSQIVAPSDERLRWNYARDEAGNSLALVALALRAYRFENNRYPQTLSKLIPRYLKKIPDDPFGSGESLHYKIIGAEYSLYSIGVDGIDNHGRATANAKYPNGDCRHFLTSPESKGDFVAGINR